MNILINCSNLKVGGGLQVADSVCTYLNTFPQHSFTVVLSSKLDDTFERIKSYSNVDIVRHDINNSWRTLLFGRDRILDGLVDSKNIDCVLTIFGPSRWIPKIRHISGFARAHLVLPNSPYFKYMGRKQRLKSSIMNGILNVAFRRATKHYFTENPYISDLLAKKWPGYTIDTVTNYYNQVFDDPEKWEKHLLPSFDGVSILCISVNYPHKNLKISIDAARYLRENYPDFKFRFVFTVTPEQFPVPDDIKDNFELIGKVNINECPLLYSQSDISFQPTLLECFTATYPESMKMEIPIITTDLDFAHGLCGDAAVYYSPLSATEAAEAIYRVATDSALRKNLIVAGKEKLKEFDSAKERAEKLIALCEESN